MSGETKSYSPEATANASEALVKGALARKDTPAGRIHEAVQAGHIREGFERMSQGKKEAVSEEDRLMHLDQIGGGIDRDSTGQKIRSSAEQERYDKANNVSEMLNKFGREGYKGLSDTEKEQCRNALQSKLESWGPTASILRGMTVDQKKDYIGQLAENPRFQEIARGMLENRIDSSSMNTVVSELRDQSRQIDEAKDTNRTNRENNTKAREAYLDSGSTESKNHSKALGKVTALTKERDAQQALLVDLEQQLKNSRPTDKDAVARQIAQQKQKLNEAQRQLDANQEVIDRKSNLEEEKVRLEAEQKILEQKSRKTNEDLHQAEIKRGSQERSYVQGLEDVFNDASGKFVTEMAEKHLEKAQEEYDKKISESKTKQEKLFWEGFKGRYLVPGEIRRGLFGKKEAHAEWNKKDIRGDFNALFTKGEDAFFDKLCTDPNKGGLKIPGMSAAEMRIFFSDKENRNKIMAEVIKSQHAAIGLTENQQQFLAHRFPEAIINGITENPDNQEALNILKGLVPENKDLNDKEYLAKLLARKGLPGGIIGFILALLVGGVAAVALGPALPALIAGGAAIAGGAGGAALEGKFSKN